MRGSPVHAEDGLDLHLVRFEEGQYVVVQDLEGGHRPLRRVEPGPHVVAEAVEHGLDVAHEIR